MRTITSKISSQNHGWGLLNWDLHCTNYGPKKQNLTAQDFYVMNPKHIIWMSCDEVLLSHALGKEVWLDGDSKISLSCLAWWQAYVGCSTIKPSSESVSGSNIQYMAKLLTTVDSGAGQFNLHRAPVRWGRFRFHFEWKKSSNMSFWGAQMSFQEFRYFLNRWWPTSSLILWTQKFRLILICNN